MRDRILKILLVLFLIITLTMMDFVILGYNIAIAVSEETEITTNVKNVEFDAYFEDSKGNKGATFDKLFDNEETFLHLQIGVKKQGYFNGLITLENANFELKESDSAYISNIENNTITLNQINAGTTADIKIRIEPIKEKNFNVGLLNAVSNLSITGIYRDSTQKDINVESAREIKLNLIENNTTENILNELSVITNKIVKIEGEEKRIVQFSWNMGLKENNYPIKQIDSQILIPTIDGKQAEVAKVTYLNNMTSYEYDYENSIVTFSLKNEANDEGKVMWNSSGYENVILTCIYDKDVELNDAQIKTQEKITLYDLKEITSEINITLNNEEKDTIIDVTSKDMEQTIYKGKLRSGIDRQYVSMTTIKINEARVPQYLSVKEGQTTFIVDDTEVDANVYYNKTILEKEQFDTLFGENGILTIYNENGEEIASVRNTTQVNEKGYIIIDYEGKNPKAIEIRTTSPISEGEIALTNVKTIKASDKEIVETASKLSTKVVSGYNMDDNELYSKGVEKEVKKEINLENTTTEAELELNKETLSTVITNNIEIKAILKSNDEKYDLYKNPQISIEFPSQVESIKINSIDLIYENELKIKDYQVDGKIIRVNLEGEQTQYKDSAIEGANIVINADIVVNRKSSTKDEEIVMAYSNENAVTKTRQTNIGMASQNIRVVAPKEIITINSIKDLNVETIGQEEVEEVTIERGKEEKQLELQIEIMNNDENTIENVVILGDFPTNKETNNMNIELVEGITLQGVEGAKIYYTENEQATAQLEDAQNGWKEDTEGITNAKRYLIVIDKIETQASIQGTYKIKIPANLEYNQSAETFYQIEYIDSETEEKNKLVSTIIKLQTGVGPKAETKITATVSGQEISETVKNGEVIKYRIEVSNVGTEDINNLKVTGKVPEGTTMVVPEEDYEYSGITYYEELDSKTYEETIETLKAGEIVYKEYEVRVNSDTPVGTKLVNLSQINYGDVIKESNSIENTTGKGNLRVTVKRLTDRKTKLYEGQNVLYCTIIENISDERQENIKAKINLQGSLDLTNLRLVEYEKGAQDLEYSADTDIDIGALEPGKIKILRYNVTINSFEENQEKIEISSLAKNEQGEYKSNKWEDSICNFKVEINMTTSTETQYVKSRDVIEYLITVKNTGNSETLGLMIEDNIPMQLTIKEITLDGEIIEGIEGNNIVISCGVEANSISTIKIKTTVDPSEARDKAEAITNVAYATVNGKEVATTSAINHIIQANEETGSNTGEDEEKEDNDIPDSDIAEGTKTIVGLAWYDENANGKKDSNEEIVSNVKVRLLNAETNNLVKDENGTVLEATTNKNGIYILDKIGNGKYIVIFDYNTAQYGLTKYKTDGVSESENSDVMMKELTIENETKQFASTDIIEIKDDNISDINIGFIELKNFDLKLDKYVSRILLQDSTGTTIKEYNNATMAKVDLDAKKINGTTVIIEYNIVVTNNGEVEGYAKKIVDYMPSNLKFSSELNKDWYQMGEYLYSTSMANDKLAAGESKTLKLTLTKSMTGEDTGLINNRAEIAEAYNELGIIDSNSTPENNAKGENDMGEANVILSIKTGGVVYVSITITMIIALGFTVAIIIRKKLNEENK